MIEDTSTIKQIAFDLDTAELKKYYPKENWNYAYEDIKKFMKQNDFNWQQGSVYVSKSAMSDLNVIKITNELCNKYPWLNKCMRDCRMTDVGRINDLSVCFDKEADIPVRKEYKDKTDEKRHIKELKQNGFQPNRKIINAMERIDKVHGEYTDLQTISDIYKGKENALTPEIKSCAKEIGDSLKAQELSRISYR